MKAVLLLALSLAATPVSADWRHLPGPHALWVIVQPDPNEPDPDHRRNSFQLSESFPTWSVCEDRRKLTALKVKGGRLVCLPEDLSR